VSHHVLRHGGPSHLDPQHAEFRLDSGRAPERVGCRHAPDQAPEFRRNRGPTGNAASAEPSPVIPEPSAPPAHHGLGADEDQGFPHLQLERLPRAEQIEDVVEESPQDHKHRGILQRTPRRRDAPLS
jgi:hypothetical protein